ncbi:hypothetical protein I552_4112 [Mycobacterium xenopi 3993]|nr:hypothetical protein I552_4112 [Mycobacterium xenopi 3993]
MAGRVHPTSIADGRACTGRRAVDARESQRFSAIQSAVKRCSSLRPVPSWPLIKPSIRPRSAGL